MNTPLRRYTTCWLVLAVISLLLSACQTSDPPVAHAAVPETMQVQPSTPASTERGQELYRTNCAFCHGSSGERGANPLMDAVGQLDDASLAEIILFGVPEKGMPVSKKLTNEQIADLVAFIRSWNSQ
ncbi:MAG TPA: c-type cytochrome [Anaerolineales bacterium]|nr:c-type cytochrome [Anaerolineales bacterium]